MQTIQAVLSSRYCLFNGTVVTLSKKRLEAGATSTILYQNDYTFETATATATTTATATATATTEATAQKAEIMVIEGDCLEAALWLKKNHGARKPLVLNMASESTPGGGYRNGAGAQEENLHRRTNLFQCLEDPQLIAKSRQWSYPIPEFGAIYSPDVAVFRGPEEKGYPFLRVPKWLSFVAVAGYRHPPTEVDPKSEERVLDRKYAKKTKQKLQKIFEIGRERKHDVLVLSALGCGAFGNPPNHIARLFKEVINENHYDQYFRIIAFAIFDDHNSKKSHNPSGNVIPFVDAFKTDLIVLKKFLDKEEETESLDLDVDKDEEEKLWDQDKNPSHFKRLLDLAQGFENNNNFAEAEENYQIDIYASRA